MIKFINKNSAWLIMFILFYFTAVAAVDEKRSGASVTAKSGDIKNALAAEGYDINYEVSVAGPGGKSIIDFISAASDKTKNKLHIAVINDTSKLEAGVYFDSLLHKASDSAASAGALLAINGGYFANINDKIYSVGLICKNNKAYPDYIRHELYPYFYVSPDGTPDIIKSAGFKDLTQKKYGAVKDYIQTKPMLVYNSRIPNSLKANVEANNSKNPRTAIAVTADKKIICAVIEGRQEMVEGMSQVELAELLIKMKAVKAVNLDGGGSSTIVLNEKVMNRPSGGLSPFTLPGQQRPIHSIIYFKYKK